jgi:hypothetical protein
MNPFHQGILIDPQHQVTARHQNALDAENKAADRFIGHLLQLGTALLTRSFIAVLLLVKVPAVLRIKEHQRHAGAGDGPQQGHPVHLLRRRV